MNQASETNVGDSRTHESGAGPSTVDGDPHTLPVAPGHSKRSSFAVAVLLGLVLVYLIWGVLAMDVPSTTTWPGPRFFPLIIVVAGCLLLVLLVVQALRTSATTDPADPTNDSQTSAEPYSWRNLVGALVTLIAFALLLMPLGWLLAGTLLFWGTARSLGSRRTLFDLGVAAVVSAIVQLGFSAGLGLQLPVGILEVI